MLSYLKVRATAFVCLAAIVHLWAVAADRPNIVWITTEDNSANWLCLYDAEHGAPMPNVQKLAEHGVVFNHAFSNAPVCSVARSTLLTGCYMPRVGGQFHRRGAVAPMPDGLLTYPAYFRAAGYYTANRHKTDYNLKAGAAWDESSRKASYRNRAPGQPFFQVWSLHNTHEIRVHQSLDTRDPETLVRRPSSVEVHPYHPDTPLFRKTYAHYYDAHRDEDISIGKLIEQLEEDGVMDDTIIFYYGDHGGVLPRSKAYPYESGLHVPLVVYIPENWKHLFPVEAGARVDGFVSFVDFAPTVLRLAGIEVPEQMDGQPFLGEGLNLETINLRDEAFGYADRFDEKCDLVRTYRKGRYKYIRNYQPFIIDGLHNSYRYKQAAYRELQQLYEDGELNAVQRQFFEARRVECLYDLETDPHETVNLATLPEYTDTVQQMRARLTDWVKSMPDLSFYPEPVLIEDAFENPVQFGQAHKAEIAALIDIADLSLQPFSDARAGIAKALQSDDPWQRYWGLIVCSSFGDEATGFEGASRRIANSDPEPLVRTRAAEYLALIDLEDPIAVLVQALGDSQTDMEALLVLNTMALLKTLKPELVFEFDVDAVLKLAGGQKNNRRWLQDRVDFITQTSNSQQGPSTASAPYKEQQTLPIH